jgi:hypothetical protein
VFSIYHGFANFAEPPLALHIGKWNAVLETKSIPQSLLVGPGFFVRLSRGACFTPTRCASSKTKRSACRYARVVVEST